MRLGGPLFVKYTGPDEWVRAHRDLGYRAAYSPLGPDAAQDEIHAYAAAAQKADIVIAEVGVWNNPLSRDEATRKAAVEKCVKCLALADELGARCCVNLAGSPGAKWAGPCPEDLTDTTLEMIVAVVRDIIDAVRPERSFYTLEPMPWMYPDSTDSYLNLIRAIDRQTFAVHFDPVNMISSPQLYYHNGEVIHDFIERLGPHIKSCHAKDILIQDQFTVHLDEVRPGKGTLDYRTFLTDLAKLDADMPLMLEHLPEAKEYDAAAAYVRQIAASINISL